MEPLDPLANYHDPLAAPPPQPAARPPATIEAQVAGLKKLKEKHRAAQAEADAAEAAASQAADAIKAGIAALLESV